MSLAFSPGTVATDMQIAIRQSGVNPVSKMDPGEHISSEWVARAICWLCTKDANDLSGVDFSLKNEEGRARVGLNA